MDEGCLVHEEHVDIVDVVVVVAEDGWQFGHRSRVVVFSIIGSVLDLAHERIRLSNQIFDADWLLPVFLPEDAFLLRLLLLELRVPDHLSR